MFPCTQGRRSHEVNNISAVHIQLISFIYSSSQKLESYLTDGCTSFTTKRRGQISSLDALNAWTPSVLNNSERLFLLVRKPLGSNSSLYRSPSITSHHSLSVSSKDRRERSRSQSPYWRSSRNALSVFNKDELFKNKISDQHLHMTKLPPFFLLYTRLKYWHNTVSFWL